ncbi:Dam family site-specific DNA-(adenine-N6)-methyltransferase [Azospirillum sp. A1-3]|uniref:DNA adenine methylase n=1 Tax=Azospirillum sp. A1-3 TaxID=185874 RepID=UPI0020778F86|nr:Dam family site-specific DNA-(adenine-N6)-methyltransferase [Azospirillum sp. A1-3]MCM8738262.1 Dam family site-specific DNA-(adenine-N6)-methyltransferase [Azospirillum sp. A1-3]
MEKKIKLNPFVKWAGGKQGIASNLIRYFPVKYGKYYEPFVGGGSVLFTLQPECAMISDANTWLIDTYQAIKEDWNAVAEALMEMPNTKEFFLDLRAQCPRALPRAQKAANFIYLNKTCFRGLFRVNQRGQFNVPYGNYDRRYFDPANLQAVAEFLNNVDLRHGDFKISLQDVQEGDFVYLDPPYYKLGGHSEFNRYTDQQFRANDHVRLAEVCREMTSRGVHWIMSNSNTEFIRELYSSYYIENIRNRREINLKSGNRDIDELLISNRPLVERRGKKFDESDVQAVLLE